MKTKPPFKIKLIKKIIDYSLLPAYLALTDIEENLKENLLKDAKNQQKLKNKEEVDFYMIKINRKNFENKFKLEDCLNEASKGELKLLLVTRPQLALFTPRFWTSLCHIFKGMKIMILEKPAKIKNGFPVYLVSEIGIGMTVDKISYIEEDKIFLDEKPLYILARTKKVEASQIRQKELHDQNKRSQRRFHNKIISA